MTAVGMELELELPSISIPEFVESVQSLESQALERSQNDPSFRFPLVADRRNITGYYFDDLRTAMGLPDYVAAGDGPNSPTSSESGYHHHYTEWLCNSVYEMERVIQMVYRSADNSANAPMSST